MVDDGVIGRNRADLVYPIGHVAAASLPSMVATCNSSAIDFLHRLDARARALGCSAEHRRSLSFIVSTRPVRRRRSVRDHADGVTRALLKADCASGAQLIDVLVPFPGPSLAIASSGQAPKQPSHSKQLPQDRQRFDSYTASFSFSPCTTSSKLVWRRCISACACGRCSTLVVPEV